MSGDLYTSSRGGRGGGSSSRRAPVSPARELISNCTAVKTSDKRFNDALAGYIIGILIAFGVAAFCINEAVKAMKLDKLDKNNVSWYETRQVVPWVLTGVFVLAAAGMCYAIQATKEKLAADRKESFPIISSEVDVCKKFLAYKFPDSEPVQEQTTSGGVVTLPANKVIRKIKIFGCQAQIQITRTNEEDGTVKSYIIQGNTKQILNGYQSTIDALITNEPYTFNVVVTEGGQCTVSYVVADLPEELTEYVNKYQIIGRQCENRVLTIDAKNDVIDNDDCWCEV